MPGNAAIEEALDEVRSVITDLGIDVEPRRPGADLVVRLPDGGTLAIEVKGTSVLSASRARLLVETSRSHPDAAPLIVADEISKGARQLLNEAGVSWLDRRGHLRIWCPPLLLVDTDVLPLSRPGPASDNRAIRGKGGLAYAAALLIDPDDPPPIVEIARRAQLAPSSISEAGAVVRNAGLVRKDGRPLLPELFFATAAVWGPSWQWLASEPGPGKGPNDRLGLGLDDPSGPGWALTDTWAAIGWGAPLVASGAFPPALYVPQLRQFRRALDVYEQGQPSATGGARVAIAPLPFVCEPRYEVPGSHWLGAHPLFVALDLAQDPARGGEALEQWDPPSPFRRVW